MRSITSLLSAQSDDFISSCLTRISARSCNCVWRHSEASALSLSAQTQAEDSYDVSATIQHEDPKR